MMNANIIYVKVSGLHNFLCFLLWFLDQNHLLFSSNAHPVLTITNLEKTDHSTENL